MFCSGQLEPTWRGAVAGGALIYSHIGGYGWFESRCARAISIFYDVALPAVWLVLAEGIIKRGKLVVRGGVTRGRVAHGIIGVTTPKDMTPPPPSASAETAQSGTRKGTATGREAALHFGGLTSQQARYGWPRGK